MKFEIGKYYRHRTGTELAILCEAETTIYGKCFIAESNGRETICAVGQNEENSINYTEISREEWLKNFEEF